MPLRPVCAYSALVPDRGPIRVTLQFLDETQSEACMGYRRIKCSTVVTSSWESVGLFRHAIFGKIFQVQSFRPRHSFGNKTKSTFEDTSIACFPTYTLDLLLLLQVFKDELRLRRYSESFPYTFYPCFVLT